MKRSSLLLYHVKPEYDSWLKLVVSGTLALTFIPGLAVLYWYPELGWTLLGVTLFDCLLIYSVIPRRVQLFEDRLRIVLGGPLAFNVPYSQIREVRPAATEEAFVYWGLRFATSTKNLIEIVRSKGLSMVISPGDKDVFLVQMERARRA
jgi:hypothetical protein